jgi:hypothetical protein
MKHRSNLWTRHSPIMPLLVLYSRVSKGNKGLRAQPHKDSIQYSANGLCALCIFYYQISKEIAFEDFRRTSLECLCTPFVRRDLYHWTRQSPIMPLLVLYSRVSKGNKGLRANGLCALCIFYYQISKEIAFEDFRRTSLECLCTINLYHWTRQSPIMPLLVLYSRVSKGNKGLRAQPHKCLHEALDFSTIEPKSSSALCSDTTDETSI